VDPGNHALHGSPSPRTDRGNFEGDGTSHCKVYGLSAVSCAEMVEPIDLPFGLWTRLGRRKQKFNHIRQVAPMCPHGMAHWRHLADAIQSSVCGADAVLCKITLTTSYHFHYEAIMSVLMADSINK